MKKIVLAVLALFTLGFASAHSFTVGVDYARDLAVTGEFAYETDAGTFLVGAVVAPAGLDTTLSFGVATAPLVVDGAEFAAVLRAYVPVVQDGTVALGQVAASAGVQALLTDSTGLVTPVVEVGVRVPFRMESFTTVPGMYLRAGIVIDF